MSKVINELVEWSANRRLTAMESVDAQTHRGAMRHFAAAVTVITTRDDDAPLGLTATAVCSVTADPPRLVVFVNKQTAADSAILASGMLCINVLAGEQEDVARAFAGMIPGVSGTARFEYGNWGELLTGAPVLGDALAAIDCRVAKVFDESTHHAFLCEILATRERDDGEALVYLNGAFRRLPQF